MPLSRETSRDGLDSAGAALGAALVAAVSGSAAVRRSRKSALFFMGAHLRRGKGRGPRDEGRERPEGRGGGARAPREARSPALASALLGPRPSALGPFLSPLAARRKEAYPSPRPSPRRSCNEDAGLV